MPGNHNGMGIALYDDKVYGFGGGGLGTTESIVYNFEFDIWTPIEELPIKSTKN